MQNFSFIKGLLSEHCIDTVCAIRLSDCSVVRKHKLESAGFDISSSLYVYIFAMPYYTECGNERNISRYAVAKDYHAYFKALSDELLPELSKKFPQYRFAAFSDNSPIDERNAAARAGLGVIGKNGLLITKKYSSYIFLGEIITDMPTDACEAKEIETCEGCGKCISACPKEALGNCLSAITQKKGELNDDEKNAIRTHGTVWGCDICQEVCPHTQSAIKNRTIYTNIEFFKNELTPHISKELLLSMSDDEFSSRAYSWRKKETVLRNLDILEK